MHTPHLAGVGGFTTGTVLAIVAAVLFAVGSVLQHQALSGDGPGGGVDLRVLVRQPVWIVGQATTVSGSLVQVAALALAPVSIVQPMLAGALVIALGIRAVRERCLPSGGEVLGAACTIGGLTVFLLAARPAQGRPDHLPAPVVVLCVVAGVVLLVGLAARARHGTAGAVVCGVCGGIAAGCAAVLISAAFKAAARAAHVVSSGLFWLLLVAAVVVAVTSQLGSQQAYSRGALAWSLPALTVVDPLAAIPAARLLLGERLEPGHAAVWAPAGLLAVVGVVLLARTDSSCRRPVLLRPGRR
ncbi:drug/metabolite transporter (DMT)-like permease [Amycolatopsis bartoniae]|uniref:DMT family transporter n=1 Tax=Amycolatopsis bartoniae TaxID=941986 RepID=UPI0017C3DA91|nr:DMT family transporter [Amycolatopsis bartoniae]MBB2936504.1 drug/metabolite transporter (DMT)-like permease [Amycolatopsis bartoniae]